MKPGRAHIDVTALELKALVAFSGALPRHGTNRVIHVSQRFAYATDGHALALLGEWNASAHVHVIPTTEAPTLRALALRSNSGHVRIGINGVPIETLDVERIDLAQTLHNCKYAGKPESAFRWSINPSFVGKCRVVLDAAANGCGVGASMLVHAPWTELDPTVLTCGPWTVAIMPVREDSGEEARHERVARNTLMETAFVQQAGEVAA